MSLVKLTLTIPKDILEEAKKYASYKNTSLSQIISNYFQYLTQKSEAGDQAISPEIKKLMGSIKTDSNLSYDELLQESIAHKINRE